MSLFFVHRPSIAREEKESGETKYVLQTWEKILWVFCCFCFSTYCNLSVFDIYSISNSKCLCIEKCGCNEERITWNCCFSPKVITVPCKRRKGKRRNVVRRFTKLKFISLCYHLFCSYSSLAPFDTTNGLHRGKQCTKCNFVTIRTFKRAQVGWYHTGSWGG